MTRAEWEKVKTDLGPNRTSYRTLAVAAADLSLMAFAWWANHRGGWWVAAAIVSQALALVHCYLLHHEAVHKAIFVTARRNEWVGHIVGWMLFFPFLPRQRSHTLHHIWTGHPTGDPANDRAIKRFGSIDERGKAKVERMWKLWLPFFVVNDRIGLWRDPFTKLLEQPGSPRFTHEVRSERIYIALYVAALIALMFTGQISILRYFLPALFLDLCIEDLANLPHHAETPLIESQRPLPFWEQAQVTHACETVPVWSKGVLLNFNLHIAHHAFPTLPWHRLPAAQKLMAQVDPVMGKQERSELRWGRASRKRLFMDVMAHYFVLEVHKRKLVRIAPVVATAAIRFEAA